MPSVGIMSMQRIYNYGSSLQAHALRQTLLALAEDVGVRFLDYRPGQTLVPAHAGAAHGGRLRRTLSKVREYNAVDAPIADKLRFFNHKRGYATSYFPMVGIASEARTGTDVDLQVIGSDEVFNCVQDNVNVGYSRDLFGHDTSARVLASYAASFGNTTLAKIDAAGIRDSVADDLRGFDAISVRDRNSADVVEALTGARPDIHLDPTLIHNFDLAGGGPIPAERQLQRDYVIVYGYSGRFSAAENQAVRQYAASIDADVVAFGGLQGSADSFIDCDPFTLLAYFRDARAVVTDTFHGSIFSIINEVPFATIVRRSSGHSYGNQEKLGYLLQALGLKNRAWDGTSGLASVLNHPVSWDEVAAIRHEETQRSTDYLRGLVDRTRSA